MADEIQSGDTVKFNLLRMGTPVKISGFMGPKVRVSSFMGKEVYEDILMGKEVQIENPRDLPIEMQVRHGFARNCPRTAIEAV
jgi:hypothetical protein